ncbi:MAG: DNA polymerase III subunit beta [Peptoniphilus sp.]|nr:DNA polymerase III subunit beta [Peptoniphilus sp.]MDD7363536.1 DNA polymerase III subunit beta [Bacillota bacterium]MDY6044761.1 DNA polymerase III subunit beta [Peptoniphilus sp.]
MKFQIEKSTLSSIVSMVSRAISSKTNMEILEGIYMEAVDGELILRATDTEISMESRQACLVEEEGRIVLNASLFGNIVRKLPSAMVYIQSDGQKLSLKCEQAEFEIMGLNPEEYPQIPELGSSEKIVVTGESLLKSFKETQFATSNDDMRIVLTGVLLDVTNDDITFVALDGYRMAMSKIEGEQQIERALILPARSVSEISKLIDENKTLVIEIGNNHILIEFDGTKFFTKLLNGEFFQYNSLIRTQHDIEVVVDRKAFIAALERASLMTGKERNGLVKLNIHDDMLEILSNSEVGKVHETIEAKKTGEDLTIAFNARYLLEGVRVVDDEEIKMGFTDAVNPCIITPVEGDHYLYLVLPVRLANL